MCVSWFVHLLLIFAGVPGTLMAPPCCAVCLRDSALEHVEMAVPPRSASFTASLLCMRAGRSL